MPRGCQARRSVLPPARRTPARAHGERHSAHRRPRLRDRRCLRAHAPLLPGIAWLVGPVRNVALFARATSDTILAERVKIEIAVLSGTTLVVIRPAPGIGRNG